jgi:hypothetical protein
MLLSSFSMMKEIVPTSQTILPNEKSKHGIPSQIHN